MKQRDTCKEKIEFTKRFKLLLLARGHSKKSLGELKQLLGVSRAMIHAWLNESAQASIFTARIICEAFNCDFEWILTGYGTMDSFKIDSPNEAAIIEQYRNITREGRKKVLRFIFVDCEHNELDSVPKEKRQKAMKLITDQR